MYNGFCSWAESKKIIRYRNVKNARASSGCTGFFVYHKCEYLRYCKLY